MKLLLTSGGLSTEAIIAELVRLNGKPLANTSVAIINEGHNVETGDKRWAIDEAHHVAHLVGGEIDLVSLFALTTDELAARIMAKDMVYVVGGHTDYLMSRLLKAGMDTILSRLLEKVVYVGSSAGAMVMGHRVSTEFYWQAFDEGDDYGTTHYFDYLNAAIKPHLHSPQFPTRNEELYLKAAREFDGVLYGLRDDQAIVVEGKQTSPNISFVGGDPFTINQT